MHTKINMLKKGIKNMSKVETISVEKKEVDQQLISLIDKNIVDIRKAENSTSTRPSSVLLVIYFS